MEYLDRQGLIELLLLTSSKIKNKSDIILSALNDLDARKLDKLETITTQEINNLF